MCFKSGVVTFQLSSRGREWVEMAGKWKAVPAGWFLRQGVEALMALEQDDGAAARRFFPGSDDEARAAASWSLVQGWLALVPGQIRKKFPEKGKPRGWRVDLLAKQFTWPDTPEDALFGVTLEAVPPNAAPWVHLLAGWGQCSVLPYQGRWLVLAPTPWHAACAEVLLLIQTGNRPGFKVCQQCFAITEKEWRCREHRRNGKRAYAPPVERTDRRRFLDTLRQAKHRGKLSQEEYGRLAGLLEQEGLEAAREAYKKIPRRGARRATAGSGKS